MRDSQQHLQMIFSQCPFPKWKLFLQRSLKEDALFNQGIEAWRMCVEEDRVERAFVEWIWEREYLVHVLEHKTFPGTFVAWITRKTRIPSVIQCFHVTPVANVEGVERDGVLPGCQCKQSTSKRLDASHYIHVAATYDDAIDWATRHDLLHIEQFAVFRIDLHASGVSLLRDPFSRSTGYVLDTCHVAPKHLHRCEHG